MNKLPQPFWSVLLLVLGVIVAESVLFKSASPDIPGKIADLARDIIIGAIGAFSGRITSPGASNITATSSTINQPVITDETK